MSCVLAGFISNIAEQHPHVNDDTNLEQQLILPPVSHVVQLETAQRQPHLLFSEDCKTKVTTQFFGDTSCSPGIEAAL